MQTRYRLEGNASDVYRYRMIRLWCEFVGLYVLLPVALVAVRLVNGAFPVLPVLWVAACPAAFYLARRHGWGRREWFGLGLSRTQVAGMAARLSLAAALLAGGILLLEPGYFLELPRRNLGLWAVIMMAYPVLSVYPQGVLYRGFFFARYAVLFPGEQAKILAGAVVFCLAHLVFMNVWALALTLVGGVLFNRTYRRTGSMLASDAEHAVCGQLVFTCGWGRFLYHGTARIVDAIGT